MTRRIRFFYITPIPSPSWRHQHIPDRWCAQPNDSEYVVPSIAMHRLAKTDPRQISSSTPSISHQCKRQIQRQALPSNVADELAQLRLPRAVQATYLEPLKRIPTHRIPTCDLQLRSYSLRNLEVFTDFAMRAAYYLNLPVSGPVPLPRITERWTVPRSNFIFKKSQENFERITLRRLLQVQDGNAEVVSIWLAFLRKYQYFGVGVKANVYEHSGLDVVKDLDREAERLKKVTGEFAKKLELFGTKDGVEEAELERRLAAEPFKGQWGAYGAMSANSTLPPANTRVASERVSARDGTRGMETAVRPPGEDDL